MLFNLIHYTLNLMEIRTFKKADIVGVSKLVRQMAEYHHALDSFYKAGEEYSGIEEMAAAWLDDSEMQLFVADDSGELSGYIRIGVEAGPEYSKEKKIGIVYDSFVNKSVRRKGVATQLYDEALAWLKKKKVNFVELNVDSRNEGAIEFWKKCGFEAVKLRMRRKI